MVFYIEVYLDILDDYEALSTIYQFSTKELAEEFVNSVPFVCSQITFSETELILTQVEPNRPVYSKIEDAIEDAQEFYQYADTPNYRYYTSVYRVLLQQVEKVQETNKYNKFEENFETLKNEVAELKEKIQKLEKELTDKTTQEVENKIEDLEI